MTGTIDKQTYIVDSHEGSRVSGTDENFTYAIQLPPSQNYDRVVVTKCKIPKSFYTVPVGGNTFTLVENKVSATITIPPGCYNIYTFVSVLPPLLNAQSALNGNGWNYSLSIPDGLTAPSTGKFTYTVTFGNNPSFVMPSTGNIYQQFGFNKGTTNTFVGSTLVSTNVVNFQQTTTILINSDLVDNVNNKNLVSIFSGSSPDFSIIGYQLSTTESIASRKFVNTKSNIYSFSVTDEDGNILGLNGQNIVLELVFFKVPEIVQDIKPDILKLHNEAEQKYSMRTTQLKFGDTQAVLDSIDREAQKVGNPWKFNDTKPVNKILSNDSKEQENTK